MADYEGTPNEDVHTGTEGNDTLHGRGGSDTLNGGGQIDWIYGDEGDDRLMGGDGTDVLYGGTGADWMWGGTGADTYEVDNPGDLVFEDANLEFDTITASIDYYLPANVENLLLSGAAYYGVGTAADNDMRGTDLDNMLIAGAGNDSLQGFMGNDRLFGQEGNDQISGAEGDDYAVGDTGNDFINGGTGADQIYGGDGNDTLGSMEYDFNTSPATLRNMIDGASDLVVAGDGNDTLYGASGDRLYGGSGNDLYYVQGAGDLTFEDADGGIDTVIVQPGAGGSDGVYLYANVENLTLTGSVGYGVGNALANTIIGSATGNLLLGGAGNDAITGAGGNDTLFGEGGADVFVFGAGSGQDAIGDFMPGTDRIDLTGYGLTSFATIQSRMTEYQGSTAIDLGGGNFIVLNGVTMAQLHAGDFVGASAPAVTPAAVPVAVSGIAGASDAGGGLADADLWLAGVFDVPALALRLDGGPAGDMFL